MKKKMLKTALFGFSKTSVCEYIAEVNNDFNSRIKDLNQEHAKEIDWWKNKTARMEKELSEYKKSSGSISQAILEAQNYAAQRKKQADLYYDDIVEKSRIKAEKQTERLEEYKNYIDDLRNQLSAFVAKTNDELAEFKKLAENVSAENQADEENEP